MGCNGDFMVMGFQDEKKQLLWERNYQYPARLARSAVFNLSDELTTRSTWSAASGRMPKDKFEALEPLQRPVPAPCRASACIWGSSHPAGSRLCTSQTVHAPDGNGFHSI